MQDTTGVIRTAAKFISTNPLVSTIVGTVIAAGILAAIRPTRVASGRFIRWLWGVVKGFALGVGNRLGRALITEKPPTIVASVSDNERYNLKAELEVWKAEAVQGRMNYKYGETLGTFEALPEVRMVALVDHVAELLPTTGLLVRSCEEVWLSVRPQYKDDRPRSAVGDLIKILEGREHYTFLNSATALEEQSQAHLDPRPYLLCFYRRYREWREAIHNVSNYLGTNLRYAAHYAEWRLQDDKWRQELWQKLASPNLIQVRSRIREYDQEHGELATLPVADTPYEGPAQGGPGLRGSR